jgi:thioredoxin reductase (NADPH)
MNNTRRGLPLTRSHIEKIFPKLTPAQIRRIAVRVHMLVRSADLTESMSRYLIRRIEETDTIVFRPYTEIVDLEGGDHLESVRWRNSQTGQTEEHKISHVFVTTGADPNTRWLNGCVTLDAKGFIKTGPDLSPENLSAAGWPLVRQP